MLEDVKTALARTSDTLWSDLLGMAALAVVLVSALFLPSLLGAI
jgi:hypothetical protein